MKSEKILSRPPLMLSQEQREFYFENGYLLLREFVSREWLERLREVSNAFIERSRGLPESDTVLALELTHSAENPRLRRLIDPTEHHPIYWEYVSQGPLADVAEDLLGPAFKFHHSKLNFKWSSGGEEIKWHQDIQFYPHTNCSAADALPLTPRPSQTSHEGRMIRGQPARWVEFDADACQLPPDRSNQPGVTIFSSRNRERSV